MEEDRLRASIELIEQTYEFLLAYAAQGRITDEGSPVRAELRSFLARSVDALTELEAVARQAVSAKGLEPAAAAETLVAALASDAATTRALFQLVVSQPSIGSQLIDNLNASIHVRALLTDLFLLDELLRPTQALPEAAPAAGEPG